MENQKLMSGVSNFSVEEIVELFENIDRQILNLHECSSDDFLGLNAKFKAFYKEAKGISTSAGLLFLLFSEGANRKLITSLEGFYESLATNQIQIAEQLNVSLASIECMQNDLRTTYLPLRNIAQNLGTVSLLLANLNLGYCEYQAQRGFSSEDLCALREDVDAFVETAVPMVHAVKRRIANLEASVEIVENVRNKTLSGLDMVMNALHYGIILFAEKHEEANVRIPEISEKTDSCSKSIAGIITNLQYQDIIRQKMEHIQEAHQKLMSDLRACAALDELEEERKVRLLVQVRDISALQSAQLVATNREYQNAIELISQSFRDIARDMEGIASLSRDTLLAGEAGGATTISSLLQRLKRSGNVLGDLAVLIPNFGSELDNVDSSVGEFTLQIIGLHERYENICGRIRVGILENMGGGQDEKYGNIVSQLSSVLTDLEGFDTAVMLSVNKLCAQREIVLNHRAQLADSLPLWEGFKHGAERMHDIGVGLASTEQESKNLLGEIEVMSKKVSHETRDAMADIKYYDFFEKIIVEIIEGLNGLSRRIREEVGAELVSDIEEVRKLYTMASEHKIHDSFAEGDQGDVDLFGDGVVGDEQLVEDEEDGLELF